MKDNVTVSGYVDPNKFYYVPMPQTPNGLPPAIGPVVPIYPSPQVPSVCPGCGRCRFCGQPTPGEVKITWSKYE